MSLRCVTHLLFCTVVLVPCILVHCLMPTTTTNRFAGREKLQSIAKASSLKTTGSLSYYRSWRLWRDTAIELIRLDLRETLPTPVDDSALRLLSRSLGEAADVGIMPSFEDEGALAGYTLDYFCRVQLLSDILFGASEDQNGTMDDLFSDLFSGSLSTCHVASLGGGPGFDFVALALLSTFVAQQQQCSPKPISAKVFDYEPKWMPFVEAMSTSVENCLGDSQSCAFATCDIRHPLLDAMNSRCAELVEETDLWVCSYCVAENAQRLRETDFVFFRDLFAQAKEGARFVFTETTHRLWPELVDVALEEAGFEVFFPRRRGRGKSGWQLILRKRANATIQETEKEQYEVFSKDRSLHENKVKRGITRSVRKVPGAK